MKRFIGDQLGLLSEWLVAKIWSTSQKSSNCSHLLREKKREKKTKKIQFFFNIALVILFWDIGVNININKISGSV